MTKVEKLVQQRVNPQKLQNFQSSRNMKCKNGVKQAFFGFLLFIIGLFRLYNYLTVSSYCNKQIKTVKSIKTIIGIKNSKTLKLT